MIGKLSGIVDSRLDDTLILNVGGVGYEIYCSPAIMGEAQEGSALSLAIETHVREDHFHLYGFRDFAERDWFRLLTSVQGVGAKMGLALLGAYDPDSLLRIIGAQDKTMLTRVSGVGPKLAERIITELKSKVAKMGSFAPLPAAPAAGKAANAPKAKGKDTTSGLLEDAVSALTHLGYQRTEAFTVASTVLQAEGEMTLDALIRKALQQMMR